MTHCLCLASAHSVRVWVVLGGVYTHSCMRACSIGNLHSLGTSPLVASLGSLGFSDDFFGTSTFLDTHSGTGTLLSL